MSIKPSLEDKVETLYKKIQGKPNSNTSADIGSEYSELALPLVFGSDVTIDIIPTSPPQDLVTDSGFTPSSGGTRQYSSAYHHIVKYTNIVLKSIYTNDKYGFVCDISVYGSNILKNAILPLLATGSTKYDILVQEDIGGSWGAVNEASYYFDRDAGVLVFYDKKDRSLTPPCISYWRYEGRTLNDIFISNLDIHVEDNTTTINNTINTINTSINTINNITIPALDTRITDNTTSIATINNTTIPALDTRITTLNTTLDTKITGNTTSIATINNTTIPALDTRITTLNTTVTDNTTSINTINNTTIPALDTKITTNTTTLDTKITGNTTSIATINNTTIPALDTRITTLNTKVTDNTTAINTIINTTIPAIEASIVNPVTSNNAPTGWEAKYFLSQPDAPTNQIVSPATRSEVTVKWTNPDQIKIGFTNDYLPRIDQLYITMTSSLSPNPVTILSKTNLDSASAATNYYNKLIINKVAIVPNPALVVDDVNKCLTYYVSNTIVGTFSLSIHFTNSYLSSLNPNVLTMSNLAFLPTGPPSAPILTVDSTDSSNNILEVQAGQYIVTTSDSGNTAIGEDPTVYIIEYDYTYTPMSNNQRAVPLTSTMLANVVTDSQTGLMINNTNATTVILPSSLYPDTTYNVVAVAKNSVYPSISASSNIAQLLTKPYGLPSNYYFLDSRSPYIASEYTTTSIYYTYPSMESVIITVPLISKSNTSYPINGIGTLGAHLYENRGSRLSGVMQLSVHNNTSDDSNKIAIAYVDGFINTSNVVSGVFQGTSSVNNSITQSTPNTTATISSVIPTDIAPITDVRSYYYLQISPSININVTNTPLTTVTSNYTPKYLYLKQIFRNNSNISKSIAYDVCDVPINTAPVIKSAAANYAPNDYTDDLRYQTISGVRVAMGAVNVIISSLYIDNMGTTFFRAAPISYTFLNTTYTLSYNIPAGTNFSTTLSSSIFPHSKLLVGKSNYYVKSPPISFQAFNINKTNYYSAPFYVYLPLIYDSISPTEVSYTSSIVNASNTLVRGQRMRSYLITDAENKFSGPRNTAYSHSELLNNNIDLMLRSGQYITPSYSNGRIDYSSYAGNTGINYSGLDISSSAYRYMTFKWVWSNTNIPVKNIAVQINGLTLSGVSIKQKIDGVGYVIDNGTINGQELKLYYRIEGNNIQDPTNIENSKTPATGASSISTVWINANVDKDTQFETRMALLSYNGILGGNKGTSITNNSGSYTLTYSLLISDFNAMDYNGASLYVTLGLPSSSAISITSLMASYSSS